MAGDSTPKANLHADHCESDDAQQFEISERAHTATKKGKANYYVAAHRQLQCLSRLHAEFGDVYGAKLWYYELTGIKKPAVGCTGPAAVDAGRARGPRDILHKKKRRAEDDDIPIDAVDIDEDVE
ncbi:uncharacterized protein A4U43_C04F14140 [Asparagus officinalis]|uniref:Uncharacterized protein n=1 Tax=Asparagus officinalis TaxID=4686 RepID=A0A5P1F3G6_ASPOF|nr:uncharacterized protein A4U43_C04F14140 [Asparagus officinalis]